MMGQNRVMGVTFANDVDDRIMVFGKGAGREASKLINSCAINGVCGRGCLIVARDPGAKSLEALSKTSYYKTMTHNQRSTNGKLDGTLVFVSDGDVWENRRENDDGWLFTRAGKAYCGIRIAHGGYTVTTAPYKTGLFLELDDMWSPVLIQMGRADDYGGDYGAFIRSVKGNPLTHTQGKTTYTSEAGDTYQYWSNSKTLPRINGRAIDLNPARTYDSPYLVMEHGSDLAIVRHPKHKDLALDFGYDRSTQAAGKKE